MVKKVREGEFVQFATATMYVAVEWSLNILRRREDWQSEVLGNKENTEAAPISSSQSLSETIILSEDVGSIQVTLQTIMYFFLSLACRFSGRKVLWKS